MHAGAHTDYQVNLDAFRGPLDLLLYLVKREEVDVLDIPIARVADQFKKYLDVLQLIDVERAGDFLVLASTLMEIKSRMLLPRPDAAAEPEEDPRRELVRQLLLYKKIKEAAAALERREEEHHLRLGRVTPPSAKERGPAALAPVELWDLVSAFGRLLRETAAQQPHAVLVDHTPLHVHMGNVLAALRVAGGELTLRRLFTPPHTRSRLIGLFQAILELAKAGDLVPVQPEPFGDIRLRLGDAQRASS
jgi:segregation and condensation protein A